jgi:hypothetical protein
MTTSGKISAEEFDRRFDEGQSVLEHCDLSQASRPGRAKERVNVDMPKWMIDELDRYAGRNGVARQALIKLWLSDRIKAEAKAA